MPSLSLSKAILCHGNLLSVQPLNALSSKEEEQRLEEVLERLKTQVRTRRLMLYPYFRDFDRVIKLIIISIRAAYYMYKYSVCTCMYVRRKNP